MKMVYEPAVYLLGSTSFHQDYINEILEKHYQGSWMNTTAKHAELLTEFAGRSCYGSFGPKQGRKDSHSYLKNILEQGHGSVLEHASITFFIAHCSRGLMAQLTRHRAGCAFSVESTHFIRYEKNKAVMCVCGLDQEFDYHQAIDTALETSLDYYNEVFDHYNGEGNNYPKKFVQGIVRSLLPTALESKIVFTANLRALRHIIELRGAKDNVPEIRILAKKMLNIAKHVAPSIFWDFSITDSLVDGYPMISSTYKKV